MAPPPLPLIPWSKTGLLTERSSFKSSIPVHHAAVDLFVLGYPRLANKLIDALYEHSHGIEFDYSGSGKAALFALYDAWEATDTMPEYVKNPEPDRIMNGRDSGEERDRYYWKREQERLEKEVQALEKDVVEKDVVAAYRHVQEHWDKSDANELRKWLGTQLQLHHTPGIWDTLKNAEVGKALNVDEDALEDFVSEGCDLIKQRFTNGPARPYAQHSTPELLKLLDENCIARDVDLPAGKHPSDLGIEDTPDTFLKPPVTDAAIAALEERLSSTPSPDDEGNNPMLPDKHLPLDYREFLQTSNGFEDEPASQTGIFCCIEEVGKGDITWLQDLEYILFPYEHTTYGNVDNIPLGKWSGFFIGAGGDEGNVVLIPPTYLKPVLEAFEKAYAAASEREKRVYERAATDLYGGLEALRKMEWLCLACYHWDPDQHAWGGFRAYLEYCVGDAVRGREKAEKTRKEKAEQAEKKRKLPVEVSNGGIGERKSQRTK